MDQIAAAVIAGSNVEEEQWQRMTSSLQGQVDFIALAWNGKAKQPPGWMLNCGMPIGWSRVPWRNDFSEQRNASFAIARSAAAGWILWIDTDDELCVDTDLRDVIASLDPYTSAVMLRYDYAVDDDGAVQIVQWRERLLRTDVPWAWDYRVHEICEHPHGTQFARRETAWIRHHHQERDDLAVRKRNRPLVELMRRERPEVRVFRFYMGQELLAEAQSLKELERVERMQEAAEEYLAYIVAEPWTDNAYVANHHVADIYRELGHFSDALERDLQGLKLRPTWPDSYNGLALTCLLMGEPGHAEEWASLSMIAAKEPYTAQAAEPMELTYTPLMLRSVARERLGNLEGAIDDLSKASQHWLAPENVKRLKELEENLTSTADDLETLRRSRRGHSPERSIAFYTYPLFEPWHPKLEAKGGIGGAETCIMRLAAKFAEAGWRAVVYGTPGIHEGINDDGVEYWKSGDFIASEPYTVLVASRAPRVFDNVPNAKRKVLWVHDVHLGDEWRETKHGDRRTRVDAVVALSRWHAGHLRRLHGETFRKLAVVPNGLDVERYAQEPEPQPPLRFAYSSSPDRGLDTLLEMWPEVRRRWPEVELDIFYGWESIEAIISTAPESPTSRRLGMFKARIEMLLDEVGREEGGVHWHGRVPQAELAQRLYDVSVWTYPTQFMETHCITAYEMQAAGAVPVTSALAALNEAVPESWLRVNGWPDNRYYREMWMATLQHVMDMPINERHSLALQLREHALSYSWDTAFDTWMQLLEVEDARTLVAI